MFSRIYPTALIYGLHFSLAISPEAQKMTANHKWRTEDTAKKAAEDTVFVVDDNPQFRAAMRRLLGAAGYRVETYESAEEHLKRDEYEGYGCMIVDLRMPGFSGLDLQSRLNQHDYTQPIIFLTGDGDTESGVRAMKNGAVDFLSKPVDNSVLFASIENAIDRSRRERSRYVARQGAVKKLATLTNRESEVLESVVSGLRNKEIAFELNISEKTVKAHRGRAMHKIGAGSIVELLQTWNLALKPVGDDQEHNSQSSAD